METGKRPRGDRQMTAHQIYIGLFRNGVSAHAIKKQGIQVSVSHNALRDAHSDALAKFLASCGQAGYGKEELFLYADA
jgi:hypothetical protein